MCNKTASKSTQMRSLTRYVRMCESLLFVIVGCLGPKNYNYAKLFILYTGFFHVSGT